MKYVSKYEFDKDKEERFRAIMNEACDILTGMKNDCKNDILDCKNKLRSNRDRLNDRDYRFANNVLYEAEDCLGGIQDKIYAFNVVTSYERLFKTEQLIKIADEHIEKYMK